MAMQQHSWRMALVVVLAANLSLCFGNCSNCVPTIPCAQPSTCCGCEQAKQKCEDQSPLCARLEALCDNFFMVQWQQMRCACPRTCKLCEDGGGAQEAQDVPVAPICDSQTSPIDTMLLLDGSASLRDNFRSHVLQFAKDFAASFNVSREGNQLGLMQFSSYARVEIPLGSRTDTLALQSAIDAINIIDSGTRIGNALQQVQQIFTNLRQNRRPNGVQPTRICIVLTDGDSQDQVLAPANRLRQNGVRLIAIGVGSQVSRTTLLQIADDASHVYSMADFDQLNATFSESLNQKVCLDARNNRTLSTNTTNLAEAVAAESRSRWQY